MATKAKRRFVFLGGIPCFDYMIHVDWETITAVTGGRAFMLDAKILLPVGTIFKFHEELHDAATYLNPMANVEVQLLQDSPSYALEFGGKHPQQYDYTLRGELQTIFEELHANYPDEVATMEDLCVVEVTRPVKIEMGGNNRNLLEAVTTLYRSPELKAEASGVALEHHFFFDFENPKYKIVESDYGQMEVGHGSRKMHHVAGLAPRTGYVITISKPDETGQARSLDRIILANRINEEAIKFAQLTDLYFQLEHDFRHDKDFVETHLVINSITNPEEMRLIPRLLQTCYASGVSVYLCPTGTTLRCIDRMLEGKFYAAHKERCFSYRKDFIYSSLLPYVNYLILNRDELTMVDNLVAKKGIDDTASQVAQLMNRGRQGDKFSGGKVVVTGGSKGARLTERLSTQKAAAFWKEAHLPEDLHTTYADRRLVCGDDFVTSLVTTLGAGDTFTGLFIAFCALGWDGGHALRAATLGAQHFIQTRERPTVADMVHTDEQHIRMGTETEMVDVVSHHLEESGDPTRYGTIENTVITIRTSQIHHPFRETLEVAKKMAGKLLLQK
jgi:hypothetical protein